MTTKEQERKALDQIRKIVAGLGEHSYIGTAFEGCFEIAEENIDNDFGCSMKSRCELAEKNERELRKIRDELVEENKSLEREIGLAKNDLELEQFNYKTAHENAMEWQKAYKEVSDQYDEVSSKLKDAESEIIQLKAKLYDLICKGTV